jgi:biopolymer transport protein ExbD
MTKPTINVTPLIDVLLVLLIIFMVLTPLKPSAFKAKIPQEPKTKGEANPHTLVVSVGKDSSLSINKESGVGTIDAPERVVTMLKNTFAKRVENQAYAASLAGESGLTEEERIEKTVYIKAPRGLDYGSVAKVIDAVKQSGARPISLQIDDLTDN